MARPIDSPQVDCGRHPVQPVCHCVEHIWRPGANLQKHSTHIVSSSENTHGKLLPETQIKKFNNDLPES